MNYELKNRDITQLKIDFDIENIQKKITQAFITLGESESGRELLKMIPIKKIGKTSLKDYRSLRKMNLSEIYNEN